MKGNDLMNLLLSAGQSLLQDGKQTVNQQLQKAEGNSALSNLGTGAAIGGLLTALLGTQTGRGLGKNAISIGSLAALGTVAYRAYQQYQQQSANTATAATQAPLLEQQFVDDNSEKGEVLLLALIAAAKADGHIDANEQQMIEEQLQKAGGTELQALVRDELAKPLNPEDFSRYASDPALASQVYLLSVMITNQSNFMEKAYLGELARCLQLSDELAAKLNAQLS